MKEYYIYFHTCAVTDDDDEGIVGALCVHVLEFEGEKPLIATVWSLSSAASAAIMTGPFEFEMISVKTCMSKVEIVKRK